MSSLLTREDILEADDVPTDTVDVPEWGGEVRVQGLTGSARDKWESQLIRATEGTTKVKVDGQEQEMNLENQRAYLVALTVVDDDGERMFSLEDVKELGEKSGRALDRVFEKAQELSGIDEAQREGMEENLPEKTANGDGGLG